MYIYIYVITINQYGVIPFFVLQIRSGGVPDLQPHHPGVLHGRHHPRSQHLRRVRSPVGLHEDLSLRGELRISVPNTVVACCCLKGDIRAILGRNIQSNKNLKKTCLTHKSTTFQWYFMVFHRFSTVWNMNFQCQDTFFSPYRSCVRPTMTAQIETSNWTAVASQINLWWLPCIQRRRRSDDSRGWSQLVGSFNKTWFLTMKLTVDISSWLII